MSGYPVLMRTALDAAGCRSTPVCPPMRSCSANGNAPAARSDRHASSRQISPGP
jgi:hypothetical protein